MDQRRIAVFMAIPLEDNFIDVITKAQRGLRMGDEALAQRTGATTAEIAALKSGTVNEPLLRKVAGPLQLGASALVELAEKKWSPEPITVSGLEVFTSPFNDMTVNAYLIFERQSLKAAVVDTGADAGPILAYLQRENLTLEFIFLTHTHGDHIFDLDRLKEKTGASAYVGDREPIDGAESFAAGKRFSLGRLTIETRLTWGHSPGGITYVVDGLERPVAVVGDSIFAGSMGGGSVSYADAVRNNREQILTLPDATVLCPGHGPLTTVGNEKIHNPFFTDF
jgi:hydroxyacylglutathione hydrolase